MTEEQALEIVWACWRGCPEWRRIWSANSSKSAGGQECMKYMASHTDNCDVCKTIMVVQRMNPRSLEEIKSQR